MGRSYLVLFLPDLSHIQSPVWKPMVPPISQLEPSSENITTQTETSFEEFSSLPFGSPLCSSTPDPIGMYSTPPASPPPNKQILPRAGSAENILEQVKRSDLRGANSASNISETEPVKKQTKAAKPKPKLRLRILSGGKSDGNQTKTAPIHMDAELMRNPYLDTLAPMREEQHVGVSHTHVGVSHTHVEDPGLESKGTLNTTPLTAPIHHESNKFMKNRKNSRPFMSRPSPPSTPSSPGYQSKSGSESESPRKMAPEKRRKSWLSKGRTFSLPVMNPPSIVEPPRVNSPLSMHGSGVGVRHDGSYDGS
ncbi:unnamed protein product [Owenia fusiformis]|uniref:Uncharacterized protein n=1 Tax=Owenia fusiformis TaxID=6347 RepID=A0A8J1U7E9_OWEFU|nr:unnamed protein product [Owenia fusiformis]